MSLDFINKPEKTELGRPKGLRLDSVSIKVLDEYKEWLGLRGRNTALNSILAQIEKIGVVNFFKLLNGSDRITIEYGDVKGKVVNVGTNHGTINDKDLKKKRKSP